MQGRERKSQRGKEGEAEKKGRTQFAGHIGRARMLVFVRGCVLLQLQFIYCNGWWEKVNYPNCDTNIVFTLSQNHTYHIEDI